MSGELLDRRFDGLWTADGENGWDVRGGVWVLVVAGINDETGKPFTRQDAEALLDEVDLAEREAWLVEQGQELSPLFERLPVRVSAATSFRMTEAA